MFWIIFVIMNFFSWFIQVADDIIYFFAVHDWARIGKSGSDIVSKIAFCMSSPGLETPTKTNVLIRALSSAGVPNTPHLGFLKTTFSAKVGNTSPKIKPKQIGFIQCWQHRMNPKDLIASATLAPLADVALTWPLRGWFLKLFLVSFIFKIILKNRFFGEKLPNNRAFK